MTDAIKRERSGALQRFKPYPAYNDSGVEWLGEIPAHWEAAKLWQVGRAMSGGTPAREERTYWDGDIPWVSPKDMKRRLIDSSQDTVTERAIEETGIKLIAPPVVLIVVRGMILAHSFPVAITTVPVTINQDMKALTFRDGILPLFMGWLFEGIGKRLLTAVVEEAAHGTKAIRMDQWRSVIVPVPPDGEQRGISAFLDRETARIDALVAKKQRLIELLQEQRTARITRAVTKGLDASVPLKDSGVEWLGKVQLHWESLALSRVSLSKCDGPFGSGLKSEHYSESGIRVVRLQNIGWTEFLNGDRAYIDQTYAGQLGEHSVKADDVLIAGLGDEGHPVGRACVAPAEIEPAMVKADCFRFRLDRRRAVPRFAAFQLSATATAAAGSLATGATRARMNLTTTASRKVALPPLREQQAIVDALDGQSERHRALIAKVSEAVERLEELRTALISAAVTGKIDVRGDVA